MFSYQNELEIGCPAAALWSALTEPAGVQSWFAPDVRVTPGEGGSIWVSWGPGMEGESKILVWEPERRFAYAYGAGPEPPTNVTEFVIAPAGDGRCRLSLTQTGLPSQEQLDAVTHPWGLFVHLLKHGLEHPHVGAQNVTVFRYYDVPRGELWTRLLESSAYAGASAGSVVTFERGEGFRGMEFPNGAITGIFCESCGDKTALTVMSILYDPPVGAVDAVRTAWTHVANELADGGEAQIGMSRSV